METSKGKQTKELINNVHSREELECMIKAMKQASSTFYGLSIMVGNHTFIEFTGLMNEYIKMCEEALDQGIDFTQCNVHTGQSLPMEFHHAAYLGEKLGCIYSTSIADNADIKHSFLTAMGLSQPTERATKQMIHKPSLEEVAGRYNDYIHNFTAENFTGEDVYPLRTDRMEAGCESWANEARHLLWMLKTIQEDSSMSDTKIMRWLCFVQGVLWSRGVLGIGQAKADNYKILNEGSISQ